MVNAMSKLDLVAIPEDSLHTALQAMEQSLSHLQTDSFSKEKHRALSFFKEKNIPAEKRLDLWEKYCALSRRADHEKSSVATHPIEKALQSLEQEIAAFDRHVENAPRFIAEHFPKFLKKEIGHYERLQRPLTLLNTHVVRLKALYTDFLKTDLSFEERGPFLQRLLGIEEKIAPKRKRLIAEVSQKFSQDVQRFIDKNFKSEKTSQPFFVLREEVKLLQNLAKDFFVDAQTFTETRAALSRCWDDIKKWDKERKTTFECVSV